MNSLENKECSKCQYSNNSTLMHDCAFTSAQHPPVWWCEHPNKPQYGHKIDGGNAPATCPERKEAPQPQADALDVGRLVEIVRAIERAFQELPENFAINIKLANGVASGFLSGPGLTERCIANGDFVEDINAAIDAAIAASKEQAR